MANKFEKPKDPNSVADYGLDWSLRLVDDTILTSTWIVPDGITANSNSHTATTTTIWLAGGTAGETYSLTNRVVTAGGRTWDWTVQLKIKEL
jgi:hypothetical protein